MKEDLVRGEVFAPDASVIRADAQRQRAVPGAEIVGWGGSGRSWGIWQHRKKPAHRNGHRNRLP